MSNLFQEQVSAVKFQYELAARTIRIDCNRRREGKFFNSIVPMAASTSNSVLAGDSNHLKRLSPERNLLRSVRNYRDNANGFQIQHVRHYLSGEHFCISTLSITLQFDSSTLLQRLTSCCNLTGKLTVYSNRKKFHTSTLVKRYLNPFFCTINLVWCHNYYYNNSIINLIATIDIPSRLI